MKITAKEWEAIRNCPRAKKRERPKTGKSKFVLLCEKYRRNPTTIQRRIAPVAEGGQGMTLKAALRMEPMARSRCGKIGREKSHFDWLNSMDRINQAEK